MYYVAFVYDALIFVHLKPLSMKLCEIHPNILTPITFCPLGYTFSNSSTNTGCESSLNAQTRNIL